MGTTYELDDSPGSPRNADGAPIKVRVIRPDGSPSVKHVRGPGGVHDVPDDHPAALAVAAMDLGVGNGEGWRWATDAEIYAMYERQGVAIPGEFDKRSHATVSDRHPTPPLETPTGSEAEAKAGHARGLSEKTEEEAVPKRATPLPDKGKGR
jgi:hypothetical protein